MKARWSVTCAKCETTVPVGADIKPLYKRVGYRDGKPEWVRVPKRYVHAPKCPKVTPNRPGRRDVDLRTGEILPAPAVACQTDTQPQLWENAT